MMKCFLFFFSRLWIHSKIKFFKVSSIVYRVIQVQETLRVDIFPNPFGSYASVLGILRCCWNLSFVSAESMKNKVVREGGENRLNDVEGIMNPVRRLRTMDIPMRRILVCEGLPISSWEMVYPFHKGARILWFVRMIVNNEEENEKKQKKGRKRRKYNHLEFENNEKASPLPKLVVYWLQVVNSLFSIQLL